MNNFYPKILNIKYFIMHRYEHYRHEHNHYRGEKLFPEDEETEYKEFCINDGDSLSDEEKIDILKNGWNPKLYKLVKNNIDYYLRMIVPKYISQFINSEIEGTLYIGVNDDGVISGIPFKKKLYKKTFCKNLYSHIKNIYKTQNEIDSIKKNVKVIIKKIKNNCCTNIDDIDKIIKKYEEYNIIYNENIKKYKEEYKSWLAIYMKYRIQLNDMINNNIIRFELIDYIIDNIDFNTNIDINKLYDYIILLYSDNYIDIKKMCENNVFDHKKNINHLVYWLCSFQDFMINKYLKIKPTKPIRIFKDITPELMIRKLHFNNNNVDYYIIKIIVKNKYKLIKDIQVLHNDKYVKMERTLDKKGEPITIYVDNDSVRCEYFYDDNDDRESYDLETYDFIHS